MKFGLLKSKIEKRLIESYNKNKFNDNIFVFNELITKNKNISKLYYLYDELSQKKGLKESIANEFIEQSINIYENTINKINKKNINEIVAWVSDVKTENEYEKIDNLFSNNVLMLENKINSRKEILSTLISSETEKKNKEVTELPLKTMVKVANKTISNFLSKIDESEKKELMGILKEDDSTLIKKFEFIKENTINRLNRLLKEESNEETKAALKETIEKVGSEKYNKITFLKLKNLNETI